MDTVGAEGRVESPPTASMRRAAKSTANTVASSAIPTTTVGWQPSTAKLMIRMTRYAAAVMAAG